MMTSKRALRVDLLVPRAHDVPLVGPVHAMPAYAQLLEVHIEKLLTLTIATNGRNCRD